MSVPVLVAVRTQSLGGFGGRSSLLRRIRRQRPAWCLVSSATRSALLGVALLALLRKREGIFGRVFGPCWPAFSCFLSSRAGADCITHRQCQVYSSTAALVIIGDAFHNFIDGAIICTAVLTSVPLGINTAIAVAAHEIPQEVGDVAILLAAGYSRRRALILNIASGGSGIVGALAA
jgi:zinc transporter ZupT